MLLPEAIAIGSFVLATVGFMYRMSQDVKEIKKQVTNDIQHISEIEDAKRARVYERLDSVKKQQDEKFVIKEVCSMQHTQLSRDVIDVKADLKLLLKQNGQKRD